NVLMAVLQLINIVRYFLIRMRFEEPPQHQPLFVGRKNHFNPHLVFLVVFPSLTYKRIATFACSERSVTSGIETARVVPADVAGPCIKQGCPYPLGMVKRHKNH